MLNISKLKTVFSCDDILLKNILDVDSNIITKFVIIEGCRDYFDPNNGFHCMKAQKTQQAAINLLALVSCAKAMADDLTEICRMLFCNELKEHKIERNPWRLEFGILSKNFPDSPLAMIIDQYGLNQQTEPTNKFYPKVRELRNTLIHREINKTFSTTANDFFVSERFTSTGQQMNGHDYAFEVSSLIKVITNDFNDCLLKHGRESLIVLT